MTAPNDLITNKEREVLDWVVTEFLSQRKPTPRKALIRAFENPDLLDGMFKRGLLLEAGRHLYLPSMLAFEFCGIQDAKASAQNATAIVIKTLQHLYREQDKSDFSFSEIKERASALLGITDDKAIWLGVYFIREFNLLDSYASSPDAIETTTVRPSEDIIKVKDFRAPWVEAVEAKTAYWLPEGQIPARELISSLEVYNSGASPEMDTSPSTLSRFLNEKVTLIKQDGRRFEQLPASVQPDLIFTQDPTVPIQNGDHFRRELPSGVVELYEIVDAGFTQGLGRTKPHYQSKVRKVDRIPSKAIGNVSAAGFGPSRGSIDIFISHSSADAHLAKELIDLMRVALPIDPIAIRCTSVDGYRLEGGADANDQIRTEIWGARVFIGLLTPTSLASTYVLFELGARWGAKLQLKPLLAAGMRPSELRAPLSSLNALSCDHEEQILQLIREIGKILGIQPHHADSYLSNVRALATRSKEAAAPRAQTLSSAPSAAVSSAPPTAEDTVVDAQGALALSKAMVLIAAEDLKWNKELPKWTVLVQGKTLPLRPLARIVSHLAPHERVPTRKTVEMFKKLGFQVLYEGKPV